MPRVDVKKALVLSGKTKDVAKQLPMGVDKIFEMFVVKGRIV